MILNKINVKPIAFSILKHICVMTIYVLMLIGPLYGQTTQWAIQLGGQSSNAICTDFAENVFITGSFIGNVDFDPGIGIVNLPHSTSGNNTYIAKLDSSGNLIWARGISGTDVTSWGIDVDDFGNVYIAGLFYETADFNPDTITAYTLTATNQSAGNPDIFVLKLDANGNFIWAFQIGTGGFESAGNLLVVNNNIYITGRFSVTCDFDPDTGIYNLSPVSPEQVFISKFNNAGSFLWAVSLPLSYYGEFEPLALAYDNQNSLFVGSYGEIAKVDTAGTYLFKASFNNNPVSVQGYFYVKAISCDSAGNVFTCGFFSDTIDFDTDTTSAFYLNANSSLNTFFCRLNNNLNLDWAKSFPQFGSLLANSSNSAYSILSQGNSVYISGQFSDTLNLNPQAGTSFLFEHFADNLNNFNDSYLVKYTNSGTFVWGESFGGNLYDRSKVLAGAGNSLYHAGEFSDTADFNNGPVNQTLIFNGIGNFNVFIQKFAQPITSVLNLNKQEGNYVFPSPSKGEIYFSSSLVRDFSSYSVRSIDGKIILSGEITEPKINIQKCLPGIYLIEFSDKTKGQIVMRFIID